MQSTEPHSVPRHRVVEMIPSSDPAKSPTDGLEWINYRLKHSPLVEFLEYAGKFTLVVAVISGAWSGIQWQLEAGNRAKERHYRAWELINSARGSPGDGGRIDALQDLNKDGVSLAGASLEQAHLSGVDLKRAVFIFANLQGAHLEGANLQGAYLGCANLQDAQLNRANLKNANLAFANLQGAHLERANLQDAYLKGAHLGGAKLREDILEIIGTSLEVKPQEARNLTQEQLDAANGNDRTTLPDGLARPAHWSKAERNDSQPAAQPDDAWQSLTAGCTPGSDK